ncbi:MULTISPECIES: hypothetical protein [unclassified Bradyrhizobium]|uniref:hypothetical protein n=1 Tax=unclassified Bradyrhizobium TaxID=2631580 RepID=UPI002FE361E0
MPKDLFCLPTARNVVPAGPDWIHEVKYDGYRLRVERDGDRVRLALEEWARLDQPVSLDRRDGAEDAPAAIHP